MPVNGWIGVKGPKIRCFDERSDDVDSLLHRFEVYAESQGWSKGSISVSTFERKSPRGLLWVTCERCLGL